MLEDFIILKMGSVLVGITGDFKVTVDLLWKCITAYPHKDHLMAVPTVSW